MLIQNPFNGDWFDPKLVEYIWVEKQKKDWCVLIKAGIEYEVICSSKEDAVQKQDVLAAMINESLTLKACFSPTAEELKTANPVIILEVGKTIPYENDTFRITKIERSRDGCLWIESEDVAKVPTPKELLQGK